MTLTLGTGPFGTHPSGVFNFERKGPAHTLYFEDSPKRVRVEFNGETIADSEHAKLMHETGHLPVYYFPRSDVRFGLLERSPHTTHCPFKGDAEYWSIRVGDRVAENAVWGYPEPLPDAPPITDYVAFYWQKVDAWYEEDERFPAAIHPRDPYHRVDTRHSARRVRVLRGGETLADSKRTVVLFETGLRPRYYFPPEDVRTDLLQPSETRTHCPYKGEASYYSLSDADDDGADIAWYYPEPLAEASKVPGYLCFTADKVDLEVE